MLLANDEIKQLSYEEQFSLKQNTLSAMLTKYCDSELTAFDAYKSADKHYRMRAEFRIWHEGDVSFHIMFDQKTKQKYRVDKLESASSLINEAMAATIEFIASAPGLRNKLFQIDYLSSTTCELVISLLYHKSLNETWDEEAKRLQHALETKLTTVRAVSIIGRAKKQKRVLGVDYVNELISVNGENYQSKQIENSFTQPNALINQSMIEWVSHNASDERHDLLELYCGAGNFSVPLSKYYRKVLATEISKTSVAAAQDNIKNNHIENLHIARLSSEEFVQAFNKERTFQRLADICLDDYKFSTVLVDPPRAGCDKTTLALMSKFDTIVYISCNPLTLADNLAELNKTHSIKRAALFDQFPFTGHIEAGIVLTKRQDY